MRFSKIVIVVAINLRLYSVSYAPVVGATEVRGQVTAILTWDSKKVIVVGSRLSLRSVSYAPVIGTN